MDSTSTRPEERGDKSKDMMGRSCPQGAFDVLMNLVIQTPHDVFRKSDQQVDECNSLACSAQSIRFVGWIVAVSWVITKSSTQLIKA